MNPPTLSHWWLHLNRNAPDLPSEIVGFAFTGVVYGHPKLPDGELVRTSRLVSVQGREAVTQFSRYELGDPDPEWLSWLSDNGFTYDPADPAKPKRAEVAL